MNTTECDWARIWMSFIWVTPKTSLLKQVTACCELSIISLIIICICLAFGRKKLESQDFVESLFRMTQMKCRHIEKQRKKREDWILTNSFYSDFPTDFGFMKVRDSIFWSSIRDHNEHASWFQHSTMRYNHTTFNFRVTLKKTEVSGQNKRNL
jgi:hypothetical protein